MIKSDQSNQSKDQDYNRTYEELSDEFKELFPKAIRAFELIPLMYNRLTLVDNLSHKQAIKKICGDHDYLQGFSARNIRRYLPADNPSVPHRIRPSCPKSSFTHHNADEKLSIDEHEQDEIKSDERIYNYDSQGETSYPPLIPEDHKIYSHDVQANTEDGQQLRDHKKLQEQDIKKIENLDETHSISLPRIVQTTSNTGNQLIPFEFPLSFEDTRRYMNSIWKSGTADNKIWINGSLNVETGKVVDIAFGRIIE